MKDLRNNRLFKGFTCFVILNFLFEITFPIAAYALTSGPSQPEVQSFEPIGTNQMVDLFSGDFTYNIPLLDVEGYPINIAYHAGIAMDQEASWVGLGWNINPGVVNRNMRGIPDDFKGDIINNDVNLRKNWTAGATFTKYTEFFGFKKGAKYTKEGTPVNWSVGGYFNNYKGFGYNLGGSGSYKGTEKENGDYYVYQMGLGFDSQNGVDVQPSVSIQTAAVVKVLGGDGAKAEYYRKYGLVGQINSRSGLQYLGATTGVTQTRYGLIFAGGNGGAVGMNFSKESFVPRVTPNYYAVNYDFTFAWGISKYGVFSPDAVIGANFSVSGIKGKHRELPAYGFLNSHLVSADDEHISDISRNMNVPLSKHSKNLNTASHTYDVMSISGQGAGSTFRPHRGNVGAIMDNKAQSKKYPSGGVGLELGFKQETFPISSTNWKVGGDIQVSIPNAVQSAWTNEKEDNLSHEGLKFQSTKNGEQSYEAAYYKSFGEHTRSDEEYYESFGMERAIRIGMDEEGIKSKLLNYFETEGDLTYDINEGLFRTQRDKRNAVMSYLTAEEASQYGLGKTIDNYSYDVNGEPVFVSDALASVSVDQIHHNQYDKSSISRTQDYRKGHHISEVTNINPDGSRYVYGIPVYNITQEEINYDVDWDQRLTPAGEYDCSTGLITPTSKEQSLLNEGGIAHAYSSSQLPGYAHSFLLTAVLSADYVDVNNNGPDDQDLGTYTKFNYSSDQISHQWRSPYKDAIHNRGRVNDELDDQGSFVKGTKEVWYLHSIETKNYVAEFHTSIRLDARDAKDVLEGGLGDANARKLDKIILYSKKDRRINGANAIPIKTVHFEYSYDLCKRVDNNKYPQNQGGLLHPLASHSSAYRDWGNNPFPQNEMQGKLTLHKIYFTYGKNERGKSSPYIFEYLGQNPNYDLKAYDRWGNYQENLSCLDSKTNAEFPWVRQGDRNQANLNAATWSMTDVYLPSGGHLKISYEADDYSHVQNEGAMQMTQIKGFSKTSRAFHDNLSNLADDKLFELCSGKNNEEDISKFIYFELQDPIPTNDEAVFFNNYIRDLDHVALYNEVRVLKTGNRYVDGYEMVESYADIDKSGDWYGMCNNGNIGWVKVKTVSVGDRENADKRAHPISKTAWQMVRMEMPFVAYPEANKQRQATQDIPTAKQIINWLPLFKDLIKTAKGFNAFLRDRGVADEVWFTGSEDAGGIPQLKNCFIRLLSPKGSKIGGGHRVKQIEINDQWDILTNSAEESHSYGQVYDYSNLDGTSSGVAIYEPLIGGVENPLVNPIFAHELKAIGAPDDYIYAIGPIGEEFYPAPSVGYGRVTVRNIKPGDVGLAEKVTKHGTGSVVNEFYTAKDFPVLSNDHTSLQAKMRRMLGLSLFGFTRVLAEATQGFAIELNDMHGKPKATRTYPENSDIPLTQIEYYYHTMPSTTKGLRLSNRVTVLNKDGSFEHDVMVGEDIEVVVDSRINLERNNSFKTQINTDGFLLTVPPIPIAAFVPVIYPSYKRSQTDIKMSSTTKIIHKYGILKKVVVRDLDAETVAENVAFDGETGQVLLTKTNTEYNTYKYALSIPAHFAYQGMSGAYKNINYVTGSMQVTNGVGVSNDGILVPGDEMLVVASSNSFDEKVWVLNADGPTDQATFIDAGGCNIPDGIYTFKVIRSGHRNMQAIQIGGVLQMEDPLISGTYENYSKVLSSSATVFSDDWYAKNQTEFGIIACENRAGGEGGEGCEPTMEDFLASMFGCDSRLLNDGSDEEPNDVPCDHDPCEKCQTYTEPGGGPVTFTIPPGNLKHAPTDPRNNKDVTVLEDALGCFYIINDALCEISKECPGGFKSSPPKWDQNRINYSDIQYASLNGEPFLLSPHRLEVTSTTNVNNSLHVTSSGGSSALKYRAISEPPDVYTIEIGYDGQPSLCTVTLTSHLNYGLNDFSFEAFIPNGTSVDPINYNNYNLVSSPLSQTIFGCSGSGLKTVKFYFEPKQRTLNVAGIGPITVDPPLALVYGSPAYYPAVHPAPLPGEHHYPSNDPIDHAAFTAVLDCQCESRPNGKQDKKQLEVLPHGNGVNPYLNGMKGNWKPFESYIYYDKTDDNNNGDKSDDGFRRNPEISATDLNDQDISKAGTINNFTPFWQSGQAISNYDWTAPTNLNGAQPWSLISRVTLHHPNGYDLEAIDASGIYSAAQYSEETDVVVAVTSNSKYQNTLFENFEDYDNLNFYAYCDENENLITEGNFIPTEMSRFQRHWYIWPNFIRGVGETIDRGAVTENAAHSGRKALELNPNAEAMVVYIKKTEIPEACSPLGYEPSQEQYIPSFLPQAGNYLLSYWIKTEDETNRAITMDYNGGYVTLDLVEAEVEVEGWKKVTYKFTLTQDIEDVPLRIVLFNTTQLPVFIDDLRIYPEKANMKSYVYDRNKLKVMAELDANNFATFYEYDDQGGLTRVKKETVRGIMTIQETRSNTRKNPTQ